MLPWEAANNLQLDMAKFKRVVTLLVRIREKPVKMEASVELIINLGDKIHKKIVR